MGELQPYNLCPLCITEASSLTYSPQTDRKEVLLLEKTCMIPYQCKGKGRDAGVQSPLVTVCPLHLAT